MDLSTLEERAKNIQLKIYQPDDTLYCIGHGGPLVEWHVHKPEALPAIVKHPEFNLGASYVRGDWDMDTRQLPRLVQTLLPKIAKPGLLHNRPLVRRLLARVSRTRSRNLQPRWQDISLAASRACLGEDLFQACGWFSEPGVTLEQAQRTQCRRLIAKLRLESGQRVLDLDAGWGALTLFVAQHANLRVTAFCKTPEQLYHLQAEARRRGLQGRVHARAGSLKHCRGPFDRILAGGLLEHCPPSGYAALFRRLGNLLRDDGFAWLQMSGRSRGVTLSNRWLQNQLPSWHALPLLSDLGAALECTGLRILQLEDCSAHWQKNLESWGQRFCRHRAAINRQFGEKLTRHWEFMLASQQTAAGWGQLGCYEIVLGNRRSAWLPGEEIAHGFLDDLPLDLGRGIPGLAGEM
ncbi:MAG: class I SAM-dependent methyltransferase [Gammaproteobacteria bacterium]|nr:MAG: class I SAM-dependent methyltransferase [Gammaproteobacteria bacterium]